MTIRKIICVDDKRLRTKAEDVTVFSSDLRALATDMLATICHHNAVGLAAPQIGVMSRLFVAEIPPDRDGPDGPPHPQSGTSYILVNPTIIQQSTELVEGKEGCLSMPTWVGLVNRYAWVQVAALNLEGQPVKLQVDALLSRIFQHEIDHLNGILFTDRITNPAKLWQKLPVDDKS